MHIEGIDFPEEILKAINDDRLVVFAGAGVSVNEPTELPDFKKLAIEVGQLCGKDYKEENEEIDEFLRNLARDGVKVEQHVVELLEGKKSRPNEEIDEFLGDLARDGVNVKQHVAELLEGKKSRPNDFHKNILKLFRDKESIRIVTTNQDEMFEKAIRGMKLKGINVYSAPALPYGNDFSGLVYLHGKASDPGHIVITDTDFGNAYMLNGFATGFLIDLFKEYVVLFVGYSYNDPIVRYLTTAITAKNIHNAFILSDVVSQKQERTGIKGIPYGEKKHDNACAALGKIGEYTKRGIFDWQQRIINMNLDSPPIDDETIDELLDGVKQLSVQKHFCSILKGEAWPEWFDSHKLFDNLFREKSELSEADEYWANWLAENFFDSALLTLIEKHDGKVNERFCVIILKQFFKDDERHNNTLFCQYISLFIDKINESSRLYYLIQIAERRGLKDIEWSLFWKMLRFEIILEKYSSGEVIHTEHRWLCPSDLIKLIWGKYLDGNIDQPYDVFMKGLEVIEKLYKRLNYELNQKNTYSLDVLDIEKNEDSFYYMAEEKVICEIIEKSYEKLKSVDNDLATAFSRKMIKSEASLIRRLSLLFIRKYGDESPGEKIELLLENFTFHEYYEREQIFKIVADCFDKICGEKQKQIIEKIWSVQEDLSFWSGDDKEKHIFYARYNWLKWLESKCKRNPEIENKLTYIYEKYPNFKMRERPDLIISPIESGWIDSPISLEELIHLTAKDVCKKIVTYEKDVLYWYGLINAIGTVSSDDYKWGIDLINELKEQKYWNDDVWMTIFNNLNKGIDKKSKFIKILNTFDDDLLENCTLRVALFIYNCISNDKIYSELTDNLISRLLKCVKKMWGHRVRVDCGNLDFYSTTYNQTSGVLAHILIRLMTFNLKEGEIPKWFKTIVQKVIEKSKNIDEYICVINGYAAHLFYGDPSWTKEHVLKYLDSKNEPERNAAWIGFLSRVNNFNMDFGKEMTPLFQKNIKILTQLSDELRQKYIHGYVLLMIYVIDDPLQEHVANLLQNGKNKDHKSFAHSVLSFLEQMKPEERSNLWKRWLKNYWKNRNKKIPLAIEKDEYSAMICWLIGLPEYEEAVDIALHENIESVNPLHFFQLLRESEEINEFPDKTAELVIELISKAENKGTIKYISDVKETIDILKNSVTDDMLKQKLEIALD